VQADTHYLELLQKMNIKEEKSKKMKVWSLTTRFALPNLLRENDQRIRNGR